MFNADNDINMLDSDINHQNRMYIDANQQLSKQQIEQIMIDKFAPKIQRINKFQSIVMSNLMTPAAIQKWQNNQHVKYDPKNYISINKMSQRLYNDYNNIQSQLQQFKAQTEKEMKQQTQNILTIHKGNQKRLLSKHKHKQFIENKKIKCNIYDNKQSIKQVNNTQTDMTERIKYISETMIENVKIDKQNRECIDSDIGKLVEATDTLREEINEMKSNVARFEVKEIQYESIKNKFEIVNKEIKNKLEVIQIAVNHNLKIQGLHINDVIKLTIGHKDNNNDNPDERVRGCLFPITDRKSYNILQNNCWDDIYMPVIQKTILITPYYYLKIKPNVCISEVMMPGSDKNWGYNIKDWREIDMVKEWKQNKNNPQWRYILCTIIQNQTSGRWGKYVNTHPVLKKSKNKLRIRFVFLLGEYNGTNERYMMYDQDQLIYDP